MNDGVPELLHLGNESSSQTLADYLSWASAQKAYVSDDAPAPVGSQHAAARARARTGCACAVVKPSGLGTGVYRVSRGIRNGDGELTVESRRIRGGVLVFVKTFSDSC